MVVSSAPAVMGR